MATFKRSYQTTPRNRFSTSADHQANSPPSLEGFPAIDDRDIGLNCDEGSSARGRKYQKEGRVEDLRWSNDFSMLHSYVRGSGTNRYRQHIDMSSFLQFGDIDGDCDCPVNFNCKHVAAALFQCIEWLQPTSKIALGNNETAAIEDWQSRMRALHEAKQVPVENKTRQEHVIYILSLSGSIEAPIILNVQRCRRLKSGGWGKQSSANVESLSSDFRRPAYANDLDQKITRMMVKFSTVDYYYYDYSDYVIAGAEGNLILKQLLLSGRCFWQAVGDQPLRLGEAKTPIKQWIEEPRAKGTQKHHRLSISLPDVNEPWLSIATDPPHYIDPQSNSIGEIDQSLNGAQFAHLRNLPVLTDEQIEDFSRFLIFDIKSPEIPVPVELDLVHFDGLPRAHATIISQRIDGKSVNYLRLMFRYGECLLTPLDDDINNIETQADYEISAEDDTAREWLISRQPQREALLMKVLREHAFVPMPQFDSKQASPAARSPYRDWFFLPLSRAENARQWHVFLNETRLLLESQGWEFCIDPSFTLQVQQASDFSGHLSTDANIGSIGKMEWFNLGMDIKVGRQKVPLLPLIMQWLSESELLRKHKHRQGLEQQEILVEQSPNQWIKISRHIVEPIVNTLIELHAGNALNNKGQLVLPKQQVGRLLTLQDALRQENSAFSWKGGKRLQKLARQLHDFDGIKSVTPPKQLNAELRTYQQQGLNWLGFLADYQLGGILADDMGLGKTLQTLAHLLSQKQRGKLTLAALVVAPTSLLSNWQREAKRFTPGLKVHVYHGPQRHEQRRHYIDTKTQKLNCDLIITSYPLLARDKAFWSKQQFHSVILDEAQYIKNPGAQVAQVARSLHCAHRLCLTGTPMENHLGELWSLFQFLMPDFLGSQSRFNVVYRKPIENEGDIERQKHLNQRITPFMLRRTKHEVAQELPPKTEIIHTVTLPEKQARLYETIRVAMEKKVLTLLKSKGMASSQIEMLDALLKLRQVCCDPRLLKMESAQKVQHSAKLELLMELVPELLEEGRRILIFSQFTSMLGLIEAELKDRSIAYSKLTGQTRKRDEAISQFQDGHVPVFLISLKAGGVGLNLTEADTVIHYDPWWNPAAEQQATDRAYRIGQDKPVFVYKLICESTVEERILSLQKKKQDLADAMYEQGEQEQGGSNLSRLGGEELLALFSPL